MSQKVEAQGGKRGQGWDDGADYDGITKIHVGKHRRGIQYIKIDYVKNGNQIVGTLHGTQDQGTISTHTFEINHPDEYLESIEGCYDDLGVVQGLQFKTNKKTSEFVGYSEDTKFSLAVRDKKVVGFHGYAEKYLNSLGAYFVTPPPVATRSRLVGGGGGNDWDHGVFDGVRRVCVGNTAGQFMTHLKVEYQKGDKVETLQFGENTRRDFREIVIDYPYEYVTALEGRYGYDNTFKTEVIRALNIRTSMGRELPILGYLQGPTFKLEESGKQIVGFYGRRGDAMDSIGVHFAPPPVVRVTKSRLVGGRGGNAWDDGVFDGIRKVCVGNTGSTFMSHLRVEYQKGDKVETRQFGENTRRDFREIVIDYPREYVTAVEGNYGFENRFQTDVIRSLNIRTSTGRNLPILGYLQGPTFKLEESGKQIVGFYGRRGDAMDSIGVYFAPPPA